MGIKVRPFQDVLLGTDVLQNLVMHKLNEDCTSVTIIEDEAFSDDAFYTVVLIHGQTPPPLQCQKSLSHMSSQPNWMHD